MSWLSEVTKPNDFMIDVPWMNDEYFKRDADGKFNADRLAILEQEILIEAAVSLRKIDTLREIAMKELGKDKDQFWKWVMEYHDKIRAEIEESEKDKSS